MADQARARRIAERTGQVVVLKELRYIVTAMAAVDLFCSGSEGAAAVRAERGAILNF